MISQTYEYMYPCMILYIIHQLNNVVAESENSYISKNFWVIVGVGWCRLQLLNPFFSTLAVNMCILNIYTVNELSCAMINEDMFTYD